MRNKFVFSNLASLVILIIVAANGAALADGPTGDQGPPVIRLPLSAVEPDRAVPAAEWNSPYCAHWGDGCAECTRSSADVPVQCTPDIRAFRGACQRRAIVCLKEMDPVGFNRICQNFSRESYYGPFDRPTRPLYAPWKSKFVASAGDLEAYVSDFKVEWSISGGAYVSQRKPLFDFYVFDSRVLINSNKRLDITLIDAIWPADLGRPYPRNDPGGVVGLRCWRTYDGNTPRADGVDTEAKLTGPPISRIPLELIEPPRNVAPAVWKSPHCEEWDDGCTECSRQSISAAPTCAAIPKTRSDCKPHTISCRKSLMPQLHKICRLTATVSDFWLSESGTITARRDLWGTIWAFGGDNQWHDASPERSWGKEGGQRVKSAADGTYVPALLTERERHDVKNLDGFDIFCNSAY